MSGYNVIAGKEGASTFGSKYLVLLEIEHVLWTLPKVNKHRERDVNEKKRAAAITSYIHLVRSWPKIGTTKTKQEIHPTSPANGLKRIVPVFAG